jgi:hypothetical protein
MRYAIVIVAIVGCRAPAEGPSDGSGGSGDDARIADAKPEVDATTTYTDTFRFAIVGDTRPANEDDTANYPTDVITAIWQDIEDMSPRPDFAMATGDYQFSNPYKSPNPALGAQLDAYLGARAKFSNTVYAAMGNHECTGATASNCGPGTSDGVTPNYTQFMTRMVNPQGFTEPYYTVSFHAMDNSWTAKIVVIAANAWSSTQSSWLDGELAKPTTYTFVVRHESATANTAPGVTPSETIIAKHPYTLKIVGHTHTYHHYAAYKEVVCGNGGAPLTSGTNYGFAVVERLASGKLQFTEYDYQSKAVVETFVLNADGSAG